MSILGGHWWFLAKYLVDMTILDAMDYQEMWFLTFVQKFNLLSWIVQEKRNPLVLYRNSDPSDPQELSGKAWRLWNGLDIRVLAKICFSPLIYDFSINIFLPPVPLVAIGRPQLKCYWLITCDVTEEHTVWHYICSAWIGLLLIWITVICRHLLITWSY